METNHGYRVEHIMMKWFKGKPHSFDCVDFQTTKSLYEVKSCRLFLKCTNGNDKRKFITHKHKKIKTTQMGRFYVKLDNHIKLKARAEEEHKIPRYIFVVTIGKQKVWRMKSWEQVDSMMRKRSRITPVRIKDLFNEPWKE
jgi:hypothetical protein